MGEPSHGLRYFSGDDSVDWREYRRWKQWALNKMAVMDKLPKEARGSFIWTLLQGRALEVEHLKEHEYQKEGGDKVLFELLDKRWPERDRTDEIGENISEVFSLRAKEGELLRTWCARSRECFDRCSRKTGVSFPEEAKGWLLLQYSGLSEEQRAVVLARTSGDLKFEALSQAMRSCFPEFSAPKRRSSTAAHYVENDEDGWWTTPDGYGYPPQDSEMVPEQDTNFQDVELFLTEHGKDDGDGAEAEAYPEDEVAELLATTWKDRRQELARLKGARRFHQADDVRRLFRVEVEELKKRTQCRRCGKTGHWARECRVKLPAGSSSSSTAGNGPPMSASMVQFVCHSVMTANGSAKTMLDKLRSKHAERSTENELLLVSSPGYAVLDSGCGRSVIGRDTLEEFRRLWKQAGVIQPMKKAEVNVFRFGNGAQETAKNVVDMPVQLAGKSGVIKAAIIHGRAPLLLSRPALKTLNAKMDFSQDELVVFESGEKIPLQVNEAGQYIVPVARL